MSLTKEGTGMAIDDPINDDEDNEQARPKKKSGIGKILLITFSVMFLVGASVGGTLYMTGALGGDGGVLAGDDGDSSKKKPAKGGRKAKPVYVALGEPFVVNFIEGNQMRYLQVKIEAMTRDPTVEEDIDTHLPQIRNNLVMLFSGLDYATLSTVAGKQKIRDEALAEIQAVLDQETGDPGVDAVYFTSFVMQ